MGLYAINCPECNGIHEWFSGNRDQRCSSCINAAKTIEEEQVFVKITPVTFDHDVTYYVPVFQTNFDLITGMPSLPHFEYSLSDATDNEEMAWSCSPDYVLELKGRFNATTKPFKV